MTKSHNTQPVAQSFDHVDRELFRQLSRPAMLSYVEWKQGRVFEKTSTSYLHRRQILDKLGIDIFIPNPNPVAT